MKPSKLFFLAAVAAILVVLAFWSNRQARATPPAVVGQRLLPQLDLASIARVEITRQGAPTTLVRTDSGWVVTNLFGYPADLSRLQPALLKLAEQKIGDVARGVNIDTHATLVDLQDATGRPLVTLRLGAASTGHAGPRARGRYVAVAGDNRVYLVKDSLAEFDGEPRDWVGSQLLNLSTMDIQSIELAGPTGAVLTLTRDTGSLQPQGLATNEEFDTSLSYGIESACSYLTFANVADPQLTDAQTGMTAPHVYRVKLKNGDTYTARIGAAAPGGSRYLRLEAALSPAGTNATAQAERTARQTELGQKFDQWTYLLSAATAENMTRTRADLVKPKTVATNAPVTATMP